MESRKAIIQVKNLTVRFGDNLVLDDISFDVKAGEIFVVLGESGCGKSTLLRHIIGLREPEQGSVIFDDLDIVKATENEIDELRKRLGVLFQTGALFKSMNIGENVAFPLKEHTNLSPETIKEIVRIKLTMVGLAGKEKLMPDELSGGMQKRAGLARAMAFDPEILLFDEPSAGLDPITSVELDDLIIGLNESLGTTMVVVTHELQSIYKISHRVIMLDKETHGIIAEGVPKDLLDNSNDPKVIAFFSRKRIESDSVKN